MSEGRRDPDFPNPRPAQSPITTPTPDEICERLRDEACGVLRPLLTEAISLIQQQQATIERLSAEKVELREVLQLIADGGKFDDPANRLQIVRDRAHAALGKDASDE